MEKKRPVYTANGKYTRYKLIFWGAYFVYLGLFIAQMILLGLNTPENTLSYYITSKGSSLMMTVTFCILLIRIFAPNHHQIWLHSPAFWIISEKGKWKRRFLSNHQFAAEINSSPNNKVFVDGVDINTHPNERSNGE